MLLLAALVTCLSGYSQKTLISKDTVITYDFLDATKAPGDFLILHKKKVRFRIINVNRSLYTFSWEQATNNYNTTPPAIFSTLNSQALPGEAKSGNESKQAPVQNGFWDRMADYKKKAALLDELSTFQSDISFLQKNCADSFSVIEALALKKTNTFLLGRRQPTYLEAIHTLRNFLTSSVQELKQSYDSLASSFDSAQINLAIAKKEKNAKPDALNDDFSRMKDAMTKATTIHEAVVKYETTGGIQALCNQLLSINAGNFTIYSPEYTANGDDMTVSFSIDPKETMPCLSPYANFKKTVTASVKGGWKFDFSTGLLLNFSFGDNQFFDQSYRLDSVPGDPSQKKIIQNSNKNITIPSIGALLHVYRRSGRDFNWGGTFGLSLTNQTRLNYHGGLSAIIGSAQRIVLSTGVTLTQAKLISSQYKVDQLVKADLQLDPVPTDNFYRLGWFFAFTYNLTGK
ncbi:hypothetical protein DF182_22755 [Chitinophaga flava]|uniref:Uncharacterized protein n=2 Tax=Chitinophaga flava TaxID=2259036 RepID=A0A365XUH0_9BACT|nr:hypothetical protein DF182_22755 [Chitinophaga flava]